MNGPPKPLQPRCAESGPGPDSALIDLAAPRYDAGRHIPGWADWDLPRDLLLVTYPAARVSPGLAKTQLTKYRVVVRSPSPIRPGT